MNINQIVNTPFLRTSRKFPEDSPTLVREIEKTYIDIANSVNVRAIGIFPTNKPAANGQYWFIDAQKQQGFRQIYPINAADFIAGVATIPHGINTDLIFTFTHIYGTFTDGTNWYPIPYTATTSPVANFQVQVFVTPGNSLLPTPTFGNIVITIGPNVTFVSGYIILEWIANV
jgi:hypothetical protein